MGDRPVVTVGRGSHHRRDLPQVLLRGQAAPSSSPRLPPSPCSPAGHAWSESYGTKCSVEGNSQRLPVATVSGK